jgi:3-methyladenine DNA glycosylase AlkD
MDKNEVVQWLERRGTRRTVEGRARYGIEAKHAFGVTMGALLSLRKRLGKDHALSLALWESGWYEARRQMNAWAVSFENWGDCDTVCFHLFDRTPFAWEKVRQWSASPRLFVKRGAFALMACLALHDKAAPDKSFLTLLPLIEKGARDERNFVKKGVNWAPRAIGRRNAALNAAAVKVARHLADSPQPAERWVGKDALRELTSPAVTRRLAAKRSKEKI